MKCDYCKRTFEKGPVKKVIRGKRLVFCNEYCFVLWYYKVPKHDHEAMYKMYCPTTVEVKDIRELIEEE